ncbi:TetR/AcrR family transcriptional regulator [Sphingomonas daechungensis]|uniref:TetR/AcrR family transcriptional regulator n=1 Tax=Sphingomonas daechungensis TaxID=1176646 RepID=UPI0021D53682|nr:TetR/AcrR family transcriptional regulator [Sphingomonas daechungensis]
MKFGYSGTTTPKVAAEAGLSRGAMLHHFENGGALMQATIAELLDRRLRAFRRAAASPGSDVRTLVRTYWKQLLSPRSSLSSSSQLPLVQTTIWPASSSLLRQSSAPAGTSWPFSSSRSGSRIARPSTSRLPSPRTPSKAWPSTVSSTVATKP